jgi:5-methylcytosine-specific restriction protein A
MLEKLPFIPSLVYSRRKDIHAIYGGNWQSGICPSSKFPFIFIFSGKSGKQHGYKDEWENENIFAYTGEGQVGDMSFTKGNLALREHLQKGKRVFLFESLGKGFVKFITEVEFYEADYFETHDTSGKLRLGIKFFFKRIGAIVPDYKILQPELSIVAEPIELVLSNPPNVTERKGLVTSRVGQGAYRKSIIHRWEYQCAVTGFDNLKVLVASHIHPWSDSDDSQRLDVNNGILLSPTYDALFDRHLITFENSGKIILSKQIELNAFNKIGVFGNEKIIKLNNDNFDYLDKHRAKFHETY